MNYLSRPYEVRQPVQPGDINFDYTILNTLQSKYDANKAIVDQALAQYESLRGLRDVDNEYIAQKITEVKSQIDKFGSFNLAHGTTKDSILNTLKTVIDDPIVKNAVMSKAVYDNYNAQVSKIKEKTPDKYSDMNYQYGLYTGGFYDYMQGKTHKLGSVSYTPYTDLTEEHLKKLKTIKDIKGKKFIETPDGRGGIIRREIDGLEDHEIRQYLGSTFTPQELQQLQINSWGQFGGNNIEQYRDNVIGQYTQYTNGQIEKYKKDRDFQQSIVDNSSYSQTQRDNAQRLVNEYQEQIDDMSQQDLSKMGTSTIAFQLGKANYLNGISQLAKSEWSTEYKKDDVRFANQNLDIQRQRLEIAKAELNLKYREKGLLPNGEIDPTSIVSQENADTELAKILAENETGYGNLKGERDNAYNNFLIEANNQLENASNEDVKTITESLKRRGVIKEGNVFKFENPSNYETKSLVDTIHQAYKDAGVRNHKLEEYYNIKNQKGKQINEVVVPAYQKVFNEDPDKYVSIFTNMSKGDPIEQYTIDKETYAKGNTYRVKLIDFIKKAGGENNLKSYLIRNPKELTIFQNLQEGLAKIYEDGGYQPYSFIKADASQEIEEAIQRKNEETGTFTAYKMFTIVNDDAREKISKMIPAGSVLNVSDGGEGSPTSLMFDKNDNITIRKVGDQVFIDQVEVRGSGQNESNVTKRFIAEKGGDVYNEISKYVDLEKFTTVYKNVADRNTEPITTKVNLFEGNGIGVEKLQGEVSRIMPNPFPSTWFIPEKLATYNSASKELDKLSTSFGIPTEQVNEFKNKLLNNINTYKYTVASTHNPRTQQFEFYASIKDINGKDIYGSFLNSSELDSKSEFTLKNYPQVFVINTLATLAIDEYNRTGFINNTIGTL